MHEHIQVSLLLERRTKGNHACCFHLFLQVFERGFLTSISRKGRSKPGKLLNLIGHIGNKTRQLSLSFLRCKGSSMFSNARRFMNSFSNW